MQQRNFASSLVIADYPLQVLPKLAKAIGLNQAIFVQQLHYWLNSSQHFYDESYWVYNTLDGWQEQLFFWSKKTVQRVIENSRKIDVVITTKKYNTAQTDHKLWYTLNYATLTQLEITPTAPLPPVESRNSQSDQNEIVNVTTTLKSDCPYRNSQPDHIDMDNLTKTLYRTETTYRDYKQRLPIDNNNKHARTDQVGQQPDPPSDPVVVVFSNPELFQNLVDLGIHEPMIQHYLERHGEAYLEEKYKIMLETAKQKAIGNRAGFFIEALKNDYVPIKSSEPKKETGELTEEERRQKYIPDKYAHIING